jgi:hypothetical protein
MKTFFSKEHSEQEMMELMQPDYAIDSLTQLEEIVVEIEKRL